MDTYMNMRSCSSADSNPSRSKQLTPFPVNMSDTASYLFSIYSPFLSYLQDPAPS